MMGYRSSAVRLVVVVLVAAIASAGCSSPPAAAKSQPGEPGISLASPTGGPREDFPMDGFDLCSPFSHPRFLEWAPVTRAPVERAPGSCRWRGKDVIATISDETGATLAEISNNPRYRPGYADFDHNRFWVTATPTSPPYRTHLFLAAGPSQSERLLHVQVQSDVEWARSPQPDRAYTAPGLARLIVGCIGSRMTERMLATTTAAPG
jgi:hypothetical protein